MTVKDVIIGAAEILDETALCTALAEEGATSAVEGTGSTGEDATTDEEVTELSDEDKKKKKTLLKCFNDVLFEIATEYYPLVAEENFDAGKIPFSTFSKTPLKIRSVFSGEDGIGFKTGTDRIITDKKAGKVSVVYEYVPEERTDADLFDYEKTPYGKTVFCYGIAAEYCLIAGRFSEAANWESRFKNAVTAVAAPRKRTKRITTCKVWK